MASLDPIKTDVFICGGGPVGLVLAYQLTTLSIPVYIIDSADKSSPDFPMYGRACTLVPRTLELLDQLDLYDDLAQMGFVSNRSFTYDKNGERVHGKGWDVMNMFQDTFFGFNLSLRLKFSEDVFRRRLEERGVRVNAPVKMVGFEVDEGAEDGYRVSITCETPKGEMVRVKAKYLVGADGGSSAVRKIAGIGFPGLHSAQYWVRIDGIVKSNIPEARLGFGWIESETHGRILWVALDHGATRIGYVLSDELYKKYGRNMTTEQAVAEAKIACAPFDVEFEEVHWHTVYGVQQHVADRFLDQDCILLAGDAAHTHSSGTAQGMNTGMHDVVSLGWRLAGVLKNWYKPCVLQNYSDERRAIAQQLIDNDKTISMLMSGHKPEKLKDRPEDTMALLQEFLTKIATFSSGLGISYSKNLLNDVDNALANVKRLPGTRALDVMVHKNGFRRHSTRLFSLPDFKFTGKFHILIFSGSPHHTLPLLKLLHSTITSHPALTYTTLIPGTGSSFYETLTFPPFGKAYWDIDSSAHWTYGVSENLGAIVVIRPDGIVGATAGLDGFERVVLPYLERVVVEREEKGEEKVKGELGELIGVTENNLEFSVRSGEVGGLRS